MAQKTKEEKIFQTQNAYTDHYFEKGHWWLKIWQTLVALFGWICVVVPLIVTILSYLGVKYHFFKPLWTYREGIFEIQFIGVILLFAFVMVLVFSVSMALIQNRKRDRLVEQWPTFNPINQKSEQQSSINLWIVDLDLKKYVKIHVIVGLNQNKI